MNKQPSKPTLQGRSKKRTTTKSYLPNDAKHSKQSHHQYQQQQLAPKPESKPEPISPPGSPTILPLQYPSAPVTTATVSSSTDAISGALGYPHDARESLCKGGLQPRPASHFIAETNLRELISSLAMASATTTTITSMHSQSQTKPLSCTAHTMLSALTPKAVELTTQIAPSPFSREAPIASLPTIMLTPALTQTTATIQTTSTVSPKPSLPISFLSSPSLLSSSSTTSTSKVAASATITETLEPTKGTQSWISDISQLPSSGTTPECHKRKDEAVLSSAHLLYQHVYAQSPNVYPICLWQNPWNRLPSSSLPFYAEHLQSALPISSFPLVPPLPSIPLSSVPLVSPLPPQQSPYPIHCITNATFFPDSAYPMQHVDTTNLATMTANSCYATLPGISNPAMPKTQPVAFAVSSMAETALPVTPLPFELLKSSLADVAPALKRSITVSEEPDIHTAMVTPSRDRFDQADTPKPITTTTTEFMPYIPLQKKPRTKAPTSKHAPLDDFVPFRKYVQSDQSPPPEKSLYLLPTSLIIISQRECAEKLGMSHYTVSKAWSRANPGRKWPHRKWKKIFRDMNMLKKIHDIATKTGATTLSTTATTTIVFNNTVGDATKALTTETPTLTAMPIELTPLESHTLERLEKKAEYALRPGYLLISTNGGAWTKNAIDALVAAGAVLVSQSQSKPDAGTSPS